MHKPEPNSRILQQDQLELHTDKAGTDVGTLLQLDDTGIKATTDIEQVKASDADVVLHAPLPSKVYGNNPEQDVEDFCELFVFADQASILRSDSGI